MDNYNELINKLKELLHDDSISPFTQKEEAKGIRFLQLRDAILTIGDILEEDEENEIYVASIKSGLGNLGRAYICTRIINGNLYIAAYAKEGLINQHMAEKSASNLIKLIKKKAVDGSDEKKEKKESDKKSRLKLFITIGIITVILITIVAICFIIAVPFSNGTKKYNETIMQYNEAAESYNQKSSSAFLDNLEGFDNEALILSPEKTDFVSLSKSFFEGNSTNKINSDIDTLNAIIKNLKSKETVLDNIVNPDTSVVINRIKEITDISDIGYVTAENDPNQMLGKDGGYSGCIYFTLKNIDLKKVSGKNPIERGTDAGGAVEIFATKEDALSRCDYLNQFKNTLLYSGSYAAVGTLVIRISYLLDDNQQYNLTAKIVDKLIAVSK